MLHYFAKKFFRAQLLSAYIDGGNVSLYYINDEIHQLIRLFGSTTLFQDSDNNLLHTGTAQHGLSHVNVTQATFSDIQDNCTIIIQCFSWTSFEPRAQWNITFSQVCRQSFYITTSYKLQLSCLNM